MDHFTYPGFNISSTESKKSLMKADFKSLQCWRFQSGELGHGNRTPRDASTIFFANNSKTSVCAQMPVCEAVKQIDSREVFVTRSFNR